MDEADRAAIKARFLLVKEAGAKLFIGESLANFLKANGAWDDEVCVVEAPIPLSEEDE